MENVYGTDNEAYQASEQARKELLEEDPSLKELFDHPLNANKITPELLENPMFQAIQSLVYDGEPEEIAKNFCVHGVESLEESKNLEGDKDKAKIKLLDAINCFSQGVEQKCKDKQINFDLHLGLVRCNLQLKNYGKVKEEVDNACKYKKVAGMYHYGAISRFQTEKWQDCVDYCKEALKLEKDHKDSKSLMTLALAELMKEKQKMNEMDLINQLEQVKKERLYKEVMKYGIKIGKKLHFLPQDIGASLYIDDYNTLHFPVIILYDEFMQCDFIKDFPTDSTFGEQLYDILSQPAPWDPTHRYKLKDIEVYFETNMTEPLNSKTVVVPTDKKYKKVELTSNLLSVLQDEHHIVPQFPIFIVVAKDFPDFPKYSGK